MAAMSISKTDRFIVLPPPKVEDVSRERFPICGCRRDFHQALPLLWIEEKHTDGRVGVEGAFQRGPDRSRPAPACPL